MTESAHTHNASEALNERAQHLLKVLIERYISDGQPVGSRTLSRDSGLDLSPATIRNVMADLEELGFLRSPHTSAGRVPTVRGYRFFVDSLLRVKPLQDREVLDLRRHFDVARDTGQLLQTVSTVLSGVTQLAGIVMLPRYNIQTLRHIEFLPLSRHRVLVILVLNEQEVQNRIIDVDREFSPSQLQQASNLLNERFAGTDLLHVRQRLLGELQATRESMNELMETALAMADQVFKDPDTAEDYVLEGQTNLMGFAELSDVEKLRQLFEAFSEKRQILHLLDRCIHARGVQIFIGEESGYQVLDECSVVTAPYAIDDRVLGVLGVIGPTRMAYERVIPIVDVTARLLASALNSRN
ncbi:MAG: heat-inducible transcriptional repressor HrcA [Candidatus Competibacterales bacterium]|nr:heat-inducible transcriptional repressor HrcA [Candidatus Competibacterales bacterium]